MKKFLFFFLSPLLSGVLISVYIYYLLFVWKYQGPEKIFPIKPGEGFSSINYRLKKEGLIKSEKIFFQYAKLQKALTKFKSGSYLIAPGQTPIEIFHLLLKGPNFFVNVTIPEGKNLFEIGKILENAQIASAEKFISLAKNASFLQSIGIPYSRAEGYLYPDTYRFSPQTPETEIIKTMVRVFKKKVGTLKLNLNSQQWHKVVTLASIVEKETGAAEERPLIAGVFYNRLQKNMRLQSDPTTIYGIYEEFKGNLKKAHLLQKTPYNTYQINGLPEGPIANPGLDSIKATLAPARHTYLYFVSRNDGTHRFSSSYQEHLQEVRHFQQKVENRVGKSWRDLQKKKESKATP